MTEEKENTAIVNILGKIYILVIIAGSLYLIHRLRSVLLPFALAGMFAYALAPLAGILHRKGFSWKLSATLVFCLLILSGIILLLLVVPTTISQSRELIEELPEYVGEFLTLIERVNHRFFPHVDVSLPLRRFLEDVTANLPDYLTRILRWIGEFAYILVRVLFVGLVITPFILYFFLIDAAKIRSTLTGLVSQPRRKEFISLMREIDLVVGGFIRGRILISLFVGGSAAVGLFLLGIEFPLVIGIFAGVMDILPHVGPIAGAIPALVFASVHSPLHVVAVLALFGGINLLEGVYLLPRLMGMEMNLHPMTVLFAVLVGGALYGPFGLIVSIPVAGVIKVLINHAVRPVPKPRKKQNKSTR